MNRPAGRALDESVLTSIARDLSRRLKHHVWRLLHSAGYNVASIAKQQAEATRLARERWRWLETLGIGTLVDIGANTGQFARQFLGVRPGCLVYSFEPLRDCFDELQRFAADTAGLTAFNVALGDSDGKAEFFRSEFSPSWSLLQMGESHKELFPHTRKVSSDSVAVARLDNYCDHIAVRGGLLIKIDVQGAEAQVLKGGRRLLQSADAVLVEVGYLPPYDGQATIQEISELLDESGLVFMGTVDEYLRPADSLPMYGDALFVRLSAMRGAGESLAGRNGYAPVAGSSRVE